MKSIRALAGKIKRRIFRKTNEIRAFKSEIWQTDKISEAFIKGSDSSQVMIADVMDREVNVFFLKHCVVGDKVLDIGCGHGIVSEFIASHGIDVTAIDISDKLLDEFRARVAGRNLPLTILKADAYNIPYPANSFDKVVARMFLPHFRDWPVVLKEMARVTKPGGRLLVHFPSKENTILAEEVGSRDCTFATNPDTTDGWTFYAETDSKELSRVTRSIGLKVTSRTPLSFFVHNRLIGRQIGSEDYRRYQDELSERLKDDKVREFVVWFDNIVTANASPAFSHFAIITFEKER